MPDRHLLLIRLVGALAFVSGLIALAFTTLMILTTGFDGGGPTDPFDFFRSLLTIGLAYLMTGTLIGCGIPLMSVSSHTLDPEALAHYWAGLFMIMFIGLVAGFWLDLLLSYLGAMILLGLFIIRPAIIRARTRF